MSNIPDFDSAKGHYWMNATKTAAQTPGAVEKMPRKPRRTAKEMDYWRQVDRRLSRSSYQFSGIAFDETGKIIREQTA
jgi:hypothetical protein